MVIAGNARFLQAAELFRVNKPHGSAKFDFQLCVHLFIGFNGFIEIFAF